MSDGRAAPPSFSARRLAGELVWHLLPPALYFVLIRWFFPQWHMFWLFADEGFNLAKARLVMDGYALYSQVWSDQPPLLTYLLAGLFRLVGPSLNVARLLVLLFSCLLVWGGVQYLRLAWGRLPAAAAGLLLVLLPGFPTLSAAVLVGQPSLSLAVLAMLLLALWHKSRRMVWLLLSGLVMGASLMVKLYTGFLLPIFAAGLLLEAVYGPKRSRGWRQALAPALLWGLAAGGSAALCGWLLAGPASFSQLVQPHLAAATSGDYPPNSQLYPITFYLAEAWPVLALALVGGLYALQERRWLMLYPLVWMVSAFVVLLNLFPVWWHHQVLVTVPAALLASGAAAQTVQRIRRLLAHQLAPARWSWALPALGAAALVWILFARLPGTISAFSLQPTSELVRPASTEERVMRKINQFAPQTAWMVTDLPMYAFRAGINVPPELAVLSWKRMAAGELSGAQVLESLRRRRPEQVLLGRFDFPEIWPYLEDGYRLVFERPGDLRLYVRKDLEP